MYMPQPFVVVHSVTFLMCLLQFGSAVSLLVEVLRASSMLQESDAIHNVFTKMHLALNRFQQWDGSIEPVYLEVALYVGPHLDTSMAGAMLMQPSNAILI